MRATYLLTILFLMATVISPVINNHSATNESNWFVDSGGRSGDETGVIAGYVTTNNGKSPLPGAVVGLAGGSQSVRTDEMGYYRLTDVSQGQHLVSATKPGCGSDSATVSLIDWVRQDLNLVCTYSSYDIVGSVSDINSGLPLEGVTITADGENMYSITSDEDGEFEILDLKEGDYTLSANLVGYNGVSESINLNSTHVATFSLKMEEPARVSGIVRDLTRNTEEQPLFGVVVQLSGLLDGEQIYGPLETFTDENGSYEFNDLPALDYNLTFATVGYALYETQVSLSAGDDVSRDASMVILASAIEVRLVSPTYVDGANNPMPLQNIDVELHGLTNSAGRGIDRIESSDENGIVKFNNLVPPGSYVIQIRDNAQTIDGISLEFGGAEWTARELVPGQTIMKNFSMNPVPTTISGHLHTKSNVSYAANIYNEVNHEDDFIGYQNGTYDSVNNSWHNDSWYPGIETYDKNYPIFGSYSYYCEFIFESTRYDENYVCDNPHFIPEGVGDASIDVTESKLGEYHVTPNLIQSILSVNGSNAGYFALTLPPANHKLNIEKTGLQTENFGGNALSASSNATFSFYDSVLLEPKWSHLIGFIERQMVYNQNETPVQSSVNSLGGYSDWYENPRIPLVQTTISLTPKNGSGENYTAMTDERGFFELTKIPAGDYIISADGLSLTEDSNISIPDGGKVVAIQRGATTYDLATITIDSEIGHVQITDEEKNSVQFDWLSNTGGTYKIPKDGNYIISFYGGANGYDYRIINWDARNDAGSHIHLTASSGSSSGEGGLVPREYSGFIYDITGKPLADVKVEVHISIEYWVMDSEDNEILVPSKTKNYFANTQTNSDGEYTLIRNVSTLNITEGYSSLGIDAYGEFITDNFNLGCALIVDKTGYDRLWSTCGRGGPFHSRQMDFYLGTAAALDGTVTINGTDDVIPWAKVRVDGGATKWTDYEGKYEFSPMQPGLVDVYFGADGYYPEMATVEVKKPESISIPEITTLNMELTPIPHPTAERNTFKIMTGDGNGGMAELNGYVLKGVEGSTSSENELTNGYWEVDVYREKLRPGFEDPIVRVLLVVKVKSQCEGNEDISPNGTTLSFPGTPPDEEPTGERGKSTWVGMIDVANDLPCGELEFDIVVTTAMGFENDEELTQVEVKFPIRPAMPSYLLSLFLDIDEANLPNIESDYFGFEHGDSKISRDGNHLNYSIGDTTFSTKLGSSVFDPIVKVLTGGWIGVTGIEVKFENMNLNGRCGILSYDATGTLPFGEWSKKLSLEETPETNSGPHEFKFSVTYYIKAEGVTTNGVVHPNVGTDIGDYDCTSRGNVSEGIKFEFGYTYTMDVPLPGALKPVQVVLATFDMQPQFVISMKLETDVSWPFEFPLVSVMPALFAMRIITADFSDLTIALTVGMALQQDFKIASAKIEAEGSLEGIFKVTGSEHNLALNSAEGKLKFTWKGKFLIVSVKGELGPLTFFKWERGTESQVFISPMDSRFFTIDFSEIDDAYGWHTPTLLGLTATGDLRGNHWASIIQHNGETSNLNDLQPTVLTNSVNDSNWSETSVINSPPGITATPALKRLDNGSLLAVWSQTEEIDEAHPFTSMLALSRANLCYSFLNIQTNEWSAPAPIISDAFTHLMPELVVVNGTEIAVWVADRDGNIFTIDDKVVMYATWDGVQWSEAATISGSEQVIGSLSVSAADDGTILLSHLSISDATSNSANIVAHTFADGLWNGGFTVVTDASTESSPVVGNWDNKAFVAWLEKGAIEGDEMVDRLMLITQDNGTWSAPESLYSATSMDELAVSKTVQGFVTLVWNEEGPNNEYELYYLNMIESEWDTSPNLLVNGTGFVDSMHISTDYINGEFVVAYLLSDEIEADFSQLTFTEGDLGILQSELPTLKDLEVENTDGNPELENTDGNSAGTVTNNTNDDASNLISATSVAFVGTGVVGIAFIFFSWQRRKGGKGLESTDAS